MDKDRALAKVAEQYRNEGYRVTIGPGVGNLPPFADGQNIDLLAFKGDEKVVVAVELSRESLQAT